MSMTCDEATMRLLVRYGVTTVFGIPGLTQSARLDREMSAPGPSTNPTTSAPILQQQRRSTGYPTYPPPLTGAHSPCRP